MPQRIPVGYDIPTVVVGDQVTYHGSDGDLGAEVMRFDPMSRPALALENGEVVANVPTGEWSAPDS